MTLIDKRLAESQLQDTLHNCHTDCSRSVSDPVSEIAGRPRAMFYSRGVFVGLVSGIMFAKRVDLATALEYLVDYMRPGFDPLCLPSCWRGLNEAFDNEIPTLS